MMPIIRGGDGLIIFEVLTGLVEEPKPPMHKFIIAGSLRDAVTTAVIDWNWERIAQDKFRMTNGWRFDGDVVRYLSRFEQLRGMRGCTIYLGYHWNENPEWRKIHTLAYNDIRILRAP